MFSESQSDTFTSKLYSPYCVIVIIIKICYRDLRRIIRYRDCFKIFDIIKYKKMKNYIVYIFFYGYTLVDPNQFIDIKTVGNI